MLTMFAWSGFLPAIRSAGSPPGSRMKITKTRKLIANRTATIPISRRMMNVAISAPSSNADVLLDGALVLDPDLGPGVEGVTQAVAEDVQREHGEHDRDSGDEREPRGARDLILAARDQVPPRRVGQAHARAEEREPGLGEDVVRDDQREEDEDRRGDVREQVGEHDPQRARTLADGGLDELHLEQR